MEPIIFHPHYMERVWGGRSLESVYQRQLPSQDVPYGESWEMTDREEAQSVVTGGKYDGATLNTLWNEYREEVFGKDMPDCDRFPLLIKILDAQSDLSVQVHPPQEQADALGGEPKTEMWFIADAEPDAKLYVGVEAGVTKESFEQAILDGTVEEQIHSIDAKTGESIHIESGRLHAIGAGILIYEIQQNSDTTYRVYDWNRVGLNGKPRDLHVRESMMCIDFDDVTPVLEPPTCTKISDCEYFKVDHRHADANEEVRPHVDGRFAIFTVVSGQLNSVEGKTFVAGDFFLMPVGASPLRATADTEYLETIIPA